MKNKTIGIILLVLPFVGAFVVGLLMLGLLKTLLAFGVSVLIFFLVAAGCYFYGKEY